MEFSEIELIVLAKALQFVRFKSMEYDARYLAGSPHIAELHKRITEATHEFYKSRNIPLSEEWPYIEDAKGYLDVIKVRIKDTDNWKDLIPEQRNAFLQTLIYPYKVSDEIISELIRFGDRSHSLG
jgi:hypothetical protein